MNFLSSKEIKERADTLYNWLEAHSESHFHYKIVEAELKYYANLFEQMDDAGITMADVDCKTDCYSMIIRKEI